MLFLINNTTNLMTTHLALLRGINVSGHKMINMVALKKALEGIGFTNVATYANKNHFKVIYIK